MYCINSYFCGVKISDIKIAIARRKLLSLVDAPPGDPKSCQVAILLEVGDENSAQSFLEFGRELNLDKDDLKMVICREKVFKNDLFKQPLISLKDFSWNGNLSESSSAFLNAEYDVLISFTASENKMADFLVSVTRARLKVGRKKDDKDGIFDLNISADLSAPEVFTAELKKYLKILKKTA